MATRNALRIVSRRFSSGKVLSEEEKAAKNVFIKKMEQEKLAKIARQGPGELAAAGSASGAKLRRIRRFSSGKVLSEEERAAENVFIKKKEHEKLEKMARQLEKIARQLTQVVEGPGEQAAAGSASGANASGAVSTASAESGPKVSEDKAKDGVVEMTIFVWFLWYWYSKSGGN